jgi:hypothetical protein
MTLNWRFLQPGFVRTPSIPGMYLRVLRYRDLIGGVRNLLKRPAVKPLVPAMRVFSSGHAL